MALLPLFFSCQSAPPAITEDANASTDASVTTTDQNTTATDSAEAQASSETLQPADNTTPTEPATAEPVTLQLVNPSDPSKLTRTSFLFSALPSDGTLASVEFDVASGPVVADPSEPFTLVDFSSLPAERRITTVEVTSDPMLLALPAGLVDGARYAIRVRGTTADGRVSDWLSVATTLALDIPLPEFSVPSATIDTTPSVTVAGDGPVEITVDDRSFVVEGAGSYDVPFDLSAGPHEFSARLFNGYLSAATVAVSMNILANASGRPAWPRNDEPTFSPVVGLHWGAIDGAVGYQARYRVRDTEEWENLNPTADTFVRIPTRLDQGEYEWEVRAQNDAGNWFSWSDATAFSVGSFELTFVPIVREGKPASFTRGSATGSRDEQPVREIELTVPYEMSVSPLTNARLVEIVQYAADRGFVTVDADGVWTVGDDRVPLVGVGEMDYGQQFGVRVTDGRLVAVPGHEQHPAIGITWIGAVEIANFLSYVEGRQPIYDEAGKIIAPGADGYRLPTEAEWEFAARGTTNRSLPWDGSLSGRVSNYYRSFDPYEDVNEPFTANGGPTTPVRFFDGSAHAGFQTASDASPFGIRDLVGNVWEWCYDRYDPGYYDQSPAADPTGPVASDFGTSDKSIVLAVALDPNQRVVRGAAWNSREPDVRLTNRGRYSADGRSYSIGVRLVRGPID